ncbi:MAG: dihydropteroate synthase [Acidobacteria bacterium]|nr:dihydropteroate synthase [Acidobacteriota bacterium]
MGVVNVTPDSFSDGGRFISPEAALAQAAKLADEGADILDIGAESSRPGSDPVSAGDEWQRLAPVLAMVQKELPDIAVSVDTTKAEVARRALGLGASIINDISAGKNDAAMLPLAASSKAGLVLMHMRGTPKTMQAAPFYKDAPGEVAAELAERLNAAVEAGVARDRIAVDPGIGFGKRAEDNVALIRDTAPILALGRPVLIGASRKSVIGAITGASVDDRLNGTLAMHVAAMLNGARIFRVHDVAAHRQALSVAWAILGGK